MKKSFSMRHILTAALAAILACGLAAAAHAAEASDPDGGITVTVDFRPIGHDGSFRAGDAGVLLATVHNKSGKTVSGNVAITDPMLKYLDVTAIPDLERVRYPVPNYKIRNIESGAAGTVAFVVKFPDKPDGEMPSNWLSGAAFTVDGTDVRVMGSTDCRYGVPALELDSAKLERDGVIDVRNTGDGGADAVRLAVTAKSGAALSGLSGLPDGISVLGSGKIVIELGGIAPGGHVQRDVSGFLHMNADLDAGYELVHGLD